MTGTLQGFARPQHRPARHLRIATGLLCASFMVSGSAAAWAQSCRQSAGAERARELVEQCREVSPATHPPCNAQNPCALISGEIQRSCLMLDKADDIPSFCEKYRRPN